MATTLISPKLHIELEKLQKDFATSKRIYNQALDNLVRKKFPEVWDGYAIMSFVKDNRNHWTHSAYLNRHFILSFFRKGAGLAWKLSEDTDQFVRLVDDISKLPRDQLIYAHKNSTKAFNNARESLAKELYNPSDYQTFPL
jgi:hypothetical protein